MTEPSDLHRPAGCSNKVSADGFVITMQTAGEIKEMERVVKKWTDRWGRVTDMIMQRLTDTQSLPQVGSLSLSAGANSILEIIIDQKNHMKLSSKK